MLKKTLFLCHAACTAVTVLKWPYEKFYAECKICLVTGVFERYFLVICDLDGK